MPVIRTSEKFMGKGNRPEWSGVTSAGIFKIPTVGGRMDCHYHDCNEYWLIFKGKAKVVSEGKEYYVKPGDILCTKAGDEHDIIEVYEDLEAFWFEDETPKGGRIGHLHRTAEKAKGHPVPALPIPDDFPK
ncbi:MAG: cupin domain-containing protein [Chloroflexota bacterium]